LGVTEQDIERIHGSAKALFQERKTISLEDVSEYLRTVANTPMEATDIEECLTRLFEKSTGNMPAVALHQVFLFRNAAIGHWLGAYRILVLQVTIERGEDTRFLAYPFYGLADDGRAKHLGIAFGTGHVLNHLKEQGVEIEHWFPVANWTKLVPGEREENLKRFSNLGKSLNETHPLVFVAV
jgi:hypothetical protein